MIANSAAEATTGLPVAARTAEVGRSADAGDDEMQKKKKMRRSTQKNARRMATPLCPD